MGSTQRDVDFILEQLSDAGGASARKMFGEYGIYYRDKIVALFCDNQLFVKPTVGGRAFIGKIDEAPPYPGAKLWFLITGDRCEDGEWLTELVRITERELPAPKPKAPKAKSAKSKAGKPKAAKPKAAKPKAAKPKAAKPKAAKPKAAKPRAAKSKAQRSRKK